MEKKHQKNQHIDEQEMKDEMSPKASGMEKQTDHSQVGINLPVQGMKMGAGKKARNPRKVLRRLLPYLRPEIMNILLVIILVVATTSLDLMGPYLVGVAIDRFIGPGDLAGLINIVLLMLLVYSLAWVTQFIQSRQIIVITQRLMRVLRRDLFQHLQQLSLQFFDKQPTGELMSRLTNDIDAINRVLSQSIVELIASLMIMFGMAAVMLVMNVWLALAALMVLPLMMYFSITIGKGTRKSFRKVQSNLGKMNALMEENISGLYEIQAFRRQDVTMKEFDQTNLAVRDMSIRAQQLLTLLRPMLMVISNLDILVVAALGGWFSIQGLVSVGVIATFILYTRRFFEPLLTLADLYNAIESALAGAERVFEVMDQVPAVHDQPDAVTLDSIDGRVKFEDVSFAYVEDIPVLQNINLDAESGQVIALVGPTGAGKTTIVNLLSRFYDIQGGTISIDGYDIRDLKQNDLRRKLGIVLQDTFLFSDSVLENIRYGRLEATDEECVAAARMANADSFIQHLPEGYHTKLSERAGALSQGQRQLLAIARAILADPRILILDEATSSVDTRTEVEIQKALLKLMHGRTSFVIAHRLSTIRNADQVLVINQGRIIERGTHESLLSEKGFYYNLYMSQFRHAEIHEA